MINKTTALIASTLVTALFASSTAIADQASITIVSESAPISRTLDAELFPTDQSHYTGVSANRVNYVMENAPKLTTAFYSNSSAISGQAGVTQVSKSAPISKKLDAELFPTDQSHYTGASNDRVNYSMESAPISAELDAELFPDHSR